MSTDLHVIDVLFGVYDSPIQRKTSLFGLSCYSQVFKSGEYKKSCLILNTWVSQNLLVGGLYLFEIARGPAGCFDFLYPDFQDLFESGRALCYPDTPPPTDPQGDHPPVETTQLVDSRGTFLTPEILTALIEWQ